MARDKKDSDEKKEKVSLGDYFKEKMSTVTGKRHELVEPTAYEFSPSFIYHNGLVASVVQLYVRRGSNRQMSFTDVLDLIPTNPREGVKIYIVETDGVIRDDEKKQLIKANASSGRDAIENEHKDEKTARQKDASEREMDRADIEDFNAYELTLDSPEPVVYFQFALVVVGTDADSVEEQIRDLNTLLDQRHAGMRWDSVAGDQKDRFTALFTRLDKGISGEVDSSIASQYAGINLAASPGLCDSRGVVIGDDILSLVQSAAVFDFDGSTRDQAFIAIPASEHITIYERDGMPHVSSASIMAQACANDIVCHGHKAAHLVLNGFDYMAEGYGFVRAKSETAFATYDVARMTINPMQGFGKIEQVTSIYPRLTQKITNIFDIMNDFIFETGGQEGLNNKSYVMRAVDAFYTQQGLWSPLASTNPRRTRIVEVQHPETYPTIVQLLSQFTNLTDQMRSRGDTTAARAVDALHEILAASLSASMDILGQTTNIVDSNALQVYYDFGNIASDKMKQIQFLNILDYVLWRLDPGDVLCIHGANELYRVVLNTMVEPQLSAARKRGIRIVYAFDHITSNVTNTEFMGQNKSDIFTMRGPYYHDFANDVSWSLMGAMLDEEVANYAHIMNNMQLSDTIRVQATARGMCQGLLHRDLGRVNNFIRLNPMI